MLLTNCFPDVKHSMKDTVGRMLWKLENFLTVSFLLHFSI